jgi:hypothetical protein
MAECPPLSPGLCAVWWERDRFPPQLHIYLERPTGGGTYNHAWLGDKEGWAVDMQESKGEAMECCWEEGHRTGLPDRMCKGPETHEPFMKVKEIPMAWITEGG